MTNSEAPPKKEVKDYLKTYIDQRLVPIISSVSLLRDETLVHFKDVEEILPTKVDFKSLEETHDKFSVLLEKFMSKATNKFMDKQETKKTFKMFEKQLQNIFDIIISKFEEQDLTDAMLTKKPLGGWSCISC